MTFTSLFFFPSLMQLIFFPSFYFITSSMRPEVFFPSQVHHDFRLSLAQVPRMD